MSTGGARAPPGSSREGTIAMSDTSDPDVFRLEQAVRNLPRLQREIFLACRLDAMSYDEIARRTGLTSQQVERHFARAVCKIDRQMDGHSLPWWQRVF